MLSIHTVRVTACEKAASNILTDENTARSGQQSRPQKGIMGAVGGGGVKGHSKWLELAVIVSFSPDGQLSLAPLHHWDNV